MNAASLALVFRLMSPFYDTFMSDVTERLLLSGGKWPNSSVLKVPHSVSWAMRTKSTDAGTSLRPVALTSVRDGQDADVTRKELRLFGVPARRPVAAASSSSSPIMLCPAGPGRHSLWAMATYISGTSPFPEFSAVLMLDDVQVGYFDSDSDRLTRAGGGGEEAELDLGQEAVFVLRDIFSSMKRRLALVQHRLNRTAGVHVQQRLTGCEVLADGQPALIMFRDGCDAQDADSLLYNTTHFSYAGSESWEARWSGVKKAHFQALYAGVYLPFCVGMLRRLLRRHTHLVARRVRPRLRLLTKQVVGGARVTCLATDFYPRHINLMLLRDGVALEAGMLTGGEVLPNGNGLYQARTTLIVGEEELRRKHNYTCAAAHLSLDNRLQVSWRAESFRSHRLHTVCVPGSLVLAAVLLLLLLWWRRRRRHSIATATQEPPGAAALRRISPEQVMSSKMG